MKSPNLTSSASGMVPTKFVLAPHYSTPSQPKSAVILQHTSPRVASNAYSISSVSPNCTSRKSPDRSIWSPRATHLILELS
ncbi:hypothetical protein LIPSTDRAFT_104398 [Lipomyces starkeyi NRRL Y-11557]|uniref:Uncharacterized protein n=1 Tax=Lipomyces starkeyi NRRL Y-11557 TaxID=675824 RepID=A0A1E3Q8C6_LIPST|nr:hypothetical protein LIPSTDRAFT_104398 [Lipomyces starkeyi NRRL Y-11557]